MSLLPAWISTALMERGRKPAPLVIAVGLAVVVAIVAAALTGTRVVLPIVKSVAAPYLNNTSIPFLKTTRKMCAQFADAAGLYPGNKVLLLGVEIGEVHSVTNRSDHVLVDFTVPKDMDLPADVQVASYTQSVVTNRSIELSAPYSSGPKLRDDECIKLDASHTPVSVGESFGALSNLVDTITGADHGETLAASSGIQAINESLQAAAASLAGTGADFRRMLDELVTMIGDPYRADADYRRLVDSSSILTSNWLQHWDAFASSMNTLPGTVNLLGGLADGMGRTLGQVADFLPMLVAELRRFSGRVYHNATDKLFPWLRDILNAYTPHLVSFFASLPPVINWLADDIYEPLWGTHNVTFVPPSVAISPSQASAICAGLRDRNTPGADAACAPGTASDPVTLGLTNLIMSGALS